MRRFLTLAAALAFAVAFTAPITTPAAAHSENGGYTFVGPATGASTTLDDTIALYVKYVGTTAGKPTVTVNATGTIEFQVAGAADTSVECPVSGALGGIIDTTNASCNTFGEVINAINASGSNWRAVPGALLATESADNTLVALSATDTDVRIGRPLYFDNGNVSVNADLVSVVLGPPSLQSNGSFWFQGDGVNANPFGGLYSFFAAFSEKKTSGGTIGNTVIYGVTSKFEGTGATGLRYTETVRTAWTETGGATATENQSDFTNYPIPSQPGEHFVLRVSSSTSISVTNVVGFGSLAKR